VKEDYDSRQHLCRPDEEIRERSNDQQVDVEEIKSVLSLSSIRVPESFPSESIDLDADANCVDTCYRKQQLET
jgi:hypothetical protein